MGTGTGGALLGEGTCGALFVGELPGERCCFLWGDADPLRLRSEAERRLRRWLLTLPPPLKISSSKLKLTLCRPPLPAPLPPLPGDTEGHDEDLAAALPSTALPGVDGDAAPEGTEPPCLPKVCGAGTAAPPGIEGPEPEAASAPSPPRRLASIKFWFARARTSSSRTSENEKDRFPVLALLGEPPEPRLPRLGIAPSVASKFNFC